MTKYFIHNGQSEIGPFDFEQLKIMGLKNETPVWHEGLQNWTTANNILELKTIISSTILPPKFENFSHQNINTPQFSKPVYEDKRILEPKKNNIIGNILFGIGVLGAIFIIGVLIILFIRNEEPEYNENHETQVVDSSASVVVDTEKERLNKELTIKNRSIRNNITDYVVANPNNYTYNLLGGISDLEITITNSTEYQLDEVNVLVEYIKDSGDIFTNEYVTIYNIPPKQNKTVSAPDCKRGTSVNVYIEKMYSKKLHMCYEETFTPKAGDPDPYFCKLN